MSIERTIERWINIYMELIHFIYMNTHTKIVSTKWGSNYENNSGVALLYIVKQIRIHFVNIFPKIVKYCETEEF